MVLVFTMLFAGVALADSLESDSDGLLPFDRNNNSVDFNAGGVTICQGDTNPVQTVLFALRKTGQQRWDNGTVLTLDIANQVGSNAVTATVTSNDKITVPSNWDTSDVSNNTLTTTLWTGEDAEKGYAAAAMTLSTVNAGTFTGNVFFEVEDAEAEHDEGVSVSWDAIVLPITNEACAGDDVYLTRGFYSPVSMTEMNKARGGQGVPLKFNVWEDEILADNEITDPVLHLTEAFRVRSFQIACDSEEFTANEAEIAAKGESGFRYDDTAIVEDADGQFVYVWNTLKGWDGTCRQLEVTYKGEAIEVDGSDPTMYLTAKFRFGK